MSRWGAILLVAYLVFGLSRFGAGKGTRYAVLLAAAVLVFERLKTGGL